MTDSDALLRELLSSGTIRQEQIDMLMRAKDNAVEVIHGVFCGKNHDEGGECTWEIELQVAPHNGGPVSEQPAHVYWRALTQEFLRKFNMSASAFLTTYARLVDFLGRMPEEERVLLRLLTTPEPHIFNDFSTICAAVRSTEPDAPELDTEHETPQ